LPKDWTPARASIIRELGLKATSDRRLYLPLNSGNESRSGKEEKAQRGFGERTTWLANWNMLMRVKQLKKLDKHQRGRC